MIETYRLIPAATSRYVDDLNGLKTLWFMMNGSSVIVDHLERCDSVLKDKACLRFRMFVLKPQEVGGHFYDVVFNGRYHVLMQLSSPEELPAVTETMARSMVIDREEDVVSSCSLMPNIGCVCPSYVLTIRAMKRDVCWTLDYYSVDARDSWETKPENEEQQALRTLEIYTFDDGMNLAQCLQLAGF